MKIVVNDQLLTNLSAPITFGELFSMIVAKPEFRTSVICRLCLDGAERELPNYDQPVPSADLAGEEISITMEDVTEVLRRTIHDGVEFLRLMREETNICVELFRSSQAAKANQTLWQVLEKVQMFLNYVKELVQFLATVSEDRQDLAQIEQLNDRVFHLIKSLLAAQEGHDFVYIADLLEFELAPLLAEWQTFLAALIEPAGAGEKA